TPRENRRRRGRRASEPPRVPDLRAGRHPAVRRGVRRAVRRRCPTRADASGVAGEASPPGGWVLLEWALLEWALLEWALPGAGAPLRWKSRVGAARPAVARSAVARPESTGARAQRKGR